MLLKHPASLRVLQTLPVIQATDDHRSFILSTWVRSYEPFARKLVASVGKDLVRCSTEAYRTGEARVAEANWAKSKVVVSEGDQYTIHAWVCCIPGQLWHVYVPPQFRGCGLAKALVEEYAGKVYQVSKPWPSQPNTHSVTYNPWMNQ